MRHHKTNKLDYRKIAMNCTCTILYISIPAGEHVHIKCPVHGDVVVKGSNLSY